MSDVECLLPCQNILGEGPLWSAREGALYWFDIMKNELNRYQLATHAHRTWRTAEKLHAGVLCPDGRMVVTAHRFGFSLYEPGGDLKSLCNPTNELFLNDAKCDRRGRLWAGSTRRKASEQTAVLYRFDPDLTCHEMEHDLHTSNGIGWSPDDRTMYFVDTYGGGILAYDFDVDAGTISNRRILVSPDGLDGLPDGLTVDEEGCIWCAFALGGAVYRFTPEGRIDRKIEVPALFPTSCIFGGADLDTLFITTARAGRGKEELEALPLSGGLFAMKPGVRGIAETPFQPAAVRAGIEHHA
jgi:L-arabinonolactonase